MNADEIFWLRHSLSTPDMLLHVRRLSVMASSGVSNYNRTRLMNVHGRKM
jgi:hypothetical protein